MADVKHSSSGFERTSRDSRVAEKSRDVRHADSHRERDTESRDR